MTKHFIKEIGIIDAQTQALTAATNELTAAVLSGDSARESDAQDSITAAKTAITDAVGAIPRCLIDNAVFDPADGYRMFSVTGIIDVDSGGVDTRVDGSAIVAVCAAHMAQFQTYFDDYLYGSAE